LVRSIDSIGMSEIGIEPPRQRHPAIREACRSMSRRSR
jgi:hypothetical protein